MSKVKILIVDDAAFIRDMVRKTLRARFPGLDVAEAINGRKAQIQLSKDSFDLILCDWEMPEMSGIELLQWLRKEQQDTTPFVMVTSRGDKANVVEAIQAGVTDYIGKPFSSEKILAKVVKVLGKRHNLRQQEAVPTNTGRVADGSLEALGSKRIPATKPAGKPQQPAAAAAPMGSPTKPAALPKQTVVRGAAHLRFGDNTNASVIKSISLKQISLICRTQDGLPAILDSVVVDLDQNGDGLDVARINGYVHQLQANEATMDSALVNVLVSIVDQDPTKLTYLSRLIAKGSTSGAYVPGA